MSAVFGDAVVNEHGKVEDAADYIEEHRQTNVDDIVLQTTRESIPMPEKV